MLRVLLAGGIAALAAHALPPSPHISDERHGLSAVMAACSANSACEFENEQGSLTLLQTKLSTGSLTGTARGPSHEEGLVAQTFRGERLACQVDKDSVIHSFAGGELALMSLMDEGLYDRDGYAETWLVKGNAVKLQGRFSNSSKDGLPRLVAVVLAGDLMTNHRLTVEPQDGKVFWQMKGGSLREVASRKMPYYRFNKSIIVFHKNVGIDSTDPAKIDIKMQHGVRLVVHRFPHRLVAELSLPKNSSFAREFHGHCGAPATISGPAAEDLGLVSSQVTNAVSDYDNLFVKSPHRSMDASLCSLYGDPHVSVFDAPRPSLLDVKKALPAQTLHVSPGVYWLVKCDGLKVQGKYTNVSYLRGPRPFLTTIAITGKLLKHNVLEVHPLSGNITWYWRSGHKREIETEGDSLFKTPWMSIQYYNLTSLVKHPDKYVEGLDVRLMNGTRVQVNRFDYHMDVSILMPKEAALSNVRGQCGNFNGDPSDDTPEMIAQREQEITGDHALFQGRKRRRANSTLEPLKLVQANQAVASRLHTHDDWLPYKAPTYKDIYSKN